jgi:hypothetical protein
MTGYELFSEKMILIKMGFVEIAICDKISDVNTSPNYRVDFKDLLSDQSLRYYTFHNKGVLNE